MSNYTIRLLSLLLLLILSYACSTVYVPLKGSSNLDIEEAKNWNERVKDRQVDVYLKDGRVLKERTARIRSNELIYLENGDYKTLSYSYIKEIHIKPQLNSSFYIGLGLVGLSSYLFYDAAISEKNAFGSTAGGIVVPLVLTAGSGYFFYQGIESQVTVLQFD